MATDHLTVYPLPTLDRLGVAASALPEAPDVPAIVGAWLTALGAAASSPSPDISGLFIPDSHWRDILALTWDFRTFNGRDAVQAFAADRLKLVDAGSIKPVPGAMLMKPMPDLVWINAMFSFTTAQGIAFGIVRLVPASATEWKAHVVFTNLENLKAHPEQIGALRDGAPNHGKWVSGREKALAAYETESPTVLVIGGGQSGLNLAARLKVLGVRTLIVEKNARIGDNWRERYEALCLHDPVWYNHQPYFPFPTTWPVYTPAKKLGNWLENYADVLELDVWTAATVLSAAPDANGRWSVTVSRAGKPDRTFTGVPHVVFATGIGAGEGRVPEYPGAGEFKGTIIHSTQHKRAADFAGKKVVVVGACTSAHDIASELVEQGVDVTMYQRSPTYVISQKTLAQHMMRPIYWEGGPPTDVADKLAASFPHLASIELNRRRTSALAGADKALLDGLRARGFKLNNGVMDAGLLMSAVTRVGGYYMDVGASQLIIDGKIKLKADSLLASYTPTGLSFEDGSALDADVVIYATGFGDVSAFIRKLCGDKIADTIRPVWGLDKEGEMNGAWRDLGVKGLWYMTGNLSMSRFHSKHVALQIKAIEEGILKDGERYSLA
ncbi:hypothetical protein MIND_00386400 [Mycena indigotica]|uniref:Flavin-containing monooxygenase n=1 Tax=Mycena indigotica TaxID=2126181 RepID=A0A8H6T182_9AGAR|nr:uncharacterized protein MIND_00386400 [Mycena indigotica]KAF7310130.1 hypothetical protein MIND_00386400 [Mycena indigotica]